MKKSLIKKVALSALLLLGAGNVQAQKGYEVPPLSEELSTMANEVSTCSCLTQTRLTSLSPN